MILNLAQSCLEKGLSSGWADTAPGETQGLRKMMDLIQSKESKFKCI